MFLAAAPFIGFLPNIAEEGWNDAAFPMRGATRQSKHPTIVPVQKVAGNASTEALARHIVLVIH